jgi:hypothetical protein
MLKKFWPFGLFYIHFVYFVAIWYILWLFGIFFLFWYVVQRKIWQPCARRKIHCSCGQTFTAYTSLHISNIFIYYIYILSYIFTYLQISYMRIFTTYRCTKYISYHRCCRRTWGFWRFCHSWHRKGNLRKSIPPEISGDDLKKTR